MAAGKDADSRRMDVPHQRFGVRRGGGWLCLIAATDGIVEDAAAACSRLSMNQRVGSLGFVAPRLGLRGIILRFEILGDAIADIFAIARW